MSVSFPGRVLRKEAYLRQTIENNPVGFEALNGVEDKLDGFTQLELRGIEQALLLIAIEQCLGRLQFEHFYLRAQRPPMRGGSVKQLSLSL